MGEGLSKTKQQKEEKLMYMDESVVIAWWGGQRVTQKHNQFGWWVCVCVRDS